MTRRLFQFWYGRARWRSAFFWELGLLVMVVGVNAVSLVVELVVRHRWPAAWWWWGPGSGVLVILIALGYVLYRWRRSIREGR